MTGDNGLLTKFASRSVRETADHFVEILCRRGIRLFAEIDQAAEARAVGLDLRETVVVIFGNPEAGTPLMEIAPLAALDLPLKVVIWDDHGRTCISYWSPEVLAQRYDVSPTAIAHLLVIDRLTDEVAQPRDA